MPERVGHWKRLVNLATRWGWRIGGDLCRVYNVKVSGCPYESQFLVCFLKDQSFVIHIDFKSNHKPSLLCKHYKRQKQY